jgi:hypothetical protein
MNINLIYHHHFLLQDFIPLKKKILSIKELMFCVKIRLNLIFNNEENLKKTSKYKALRSFLHYFEFSSFYSSFLYSLMEKKETKNTLFKG